MKHMVFQDPSWDFRSWDYARDLPTALAATGPSIDADDPDLRSLRDAPRRSTSAKLLLYHGWSDPDISPLGTIQLYEDVVKLVAGGAPREEGLASTQEFFRLFMLPGMAHCSGGPPSWRVKPTSTGVTMAVKRRKNVVTRSQRAM